MSQESLPNLIPALYLETLVARLQKKADRVDVKLRTDAALYIARNVRLNERALEDALRRVIAYSSLAGTEISLAFAQRVLKSFIDEQGREVALDSLPELTSPPFGTKKAKVRFHTPIAADKELVLCLLEGRDGRKTRRVLEVNLRESERERLARRDVYERELERRAKKRKQG
jgi:Bacterial dnaA  protein